MRTRYKHEAYVAFVLFVSFFGLVVSVSMLKEPIQPTIAFGERRLLVGLTFGSICVSGILAVLFAGTCSRVLGVRRSAVEHLADLSARATEVFGILILHGHHAPGSDDGATHEFWLGQKSYCASCFGLLAGAILSLITIIIFLFSSWSDGYLVYFVYFLGVGGAMLGFVPALLRIGARARFILESFFVFGTCLMLIATEVVTANVAADLFVILLAVFWLIFRISLSHRNL